MLQPRSLFLLTNKAAAVCVLELALASAQMLPREEKDE
jgi:hypothetical protein